MIKRYDPITNNIFRMTKNDNIDIALISNRTRAFIQWVCFNRGNKNKMALAIIKNPHMDFLVTCPYEINDKELIKGKTYKTYLYKWDDSFFNIIAKARDCYWEYLKRRQVDEISLY